MRLVKTNDPDGTLDTNKLAEILMTEVGKACEAGTLMGSKPKANPFEDFYGHRDKVAKKMGLEITLRAPKAQTSKVIKRPASAKDSQTSKRARRTAGDTAADHTKDPEKEPANDQEAEPAKRKKDKKDKCGKQQDKKEEEKEQKQTEPPASAFPAALPAQEPSASRRPVDKAPVEQVPVEQVPVAQALKSILKTAKVTFATQAIVVADETQTEPPASALPAALPAQDPSAARRPVEQAPVEQVPVEQVPVAQAPVEQVPVAQALILDSLPPFIGKLDADSDDSD